MQNRSESAEFQLKDEAYEVSLRPKGLKDFVGHESIKKRLNVLIQASKERNDPLGHILFNGPPGLGKTTLANIIGNEMGANVIVTSGPAIDKAGDLAGILTNLDEGDILFIDEIHRLNRTIEEYLYPAIENFTLDLMLDSGPSARSVQVGLNPFTLIGATTKNGSLSAPLRSRFHSTFRLNYYSIEALKLIVERSSQLLGIEMTDEASLEVAKRARGTPRIANNLLRWVRDFAQINQCKVVDQAITVESLEMLEIDDIGLDEMDKRILSIIIDHHNGGPVGLNTIAAAMGEDATTIAEVYEPYLIMQGFIKRGPRGREVTQIAVDHVKNSD
ncbi:MAG: Holliday junction ATP-dependent DNA helicase RuvB [Chlamydiia bacterium]|nr:Holliday junction ATP-dependent DNA helicase RuvB [Chlamydiia bacterium]